MKLNYFHQLEPDADDTKLALAKAAGIVPIGCLLGGTVLTMLTNPASSPGRSPCANCNGPRERCGGTPLITAVEQNRAEELERLRGLLTGDAKGWPFKG